MGREWFLKWLEEALSKRANEKFTVKNLLIDTGAKDPTTKLVENVENRFRYYVMLNESVHFEMFCNKNQLIFVRLTDFYGFDDI
ncbi:hypothetical protein MTW86_07920 [Mammaliicoccus sciuri]|uniref:hypothetical protein n=1 Tax=Mammaliicoccus sciuri TaxID=1296 RepID=UPI001FB44D3A|nr:hypothetical protein [Mammaliicoccus sciuri]MCJ0914494.1 hypothetical protein [Mammaliicoccus sciuri]